MHKYELCLILNANLEEDAVKAEFDKATELIKRFGGEVEKVDIWGKRRLAYEIKKMTEGVYHFVVFNANADAPAEIESRLRIMESVVRFLVTRVEEPLSPKKAAKAAQKEAEREAQREAKRAKAAEAEAAEVASEENAE